MREALEYSSNRFKLTFHGLITSEEMLDANTEIVNHHGFASSRYQLWIFHSVEDMIISANEIKRIALQDLEASEKKPDVKVAIVCDSSLAFGLSRMYKAFSDESPWETMVFYTLEEAQEWLNI